MSCITCGLEVSRGSCDVIVNPQRRRFTGLGYDETTFKVHDVKLGFFTYGTKGTKSAACLWWHHIRKDSVYPCYKIDHQAIAVFNGHKILSKDTIAVLGSKPEVGRFKQDMAALERDMKKEYLRRMTAAAAAKEAALSSLDVSEQLMSTGAPPVQGQRRPQPTMVREASAVSSNASIRTVARLRPVQRQVPAGSSFRVTAATQVARGGSANPVISVAQPPIIAPAPGPPTITRSTHFTAQPAQSLQGGTANAIAMPIMPPLSTRVVPSLTGPTVPNTIVARQSTIQQAQAGGPTGRGPFDDPPPAYEPPPAYSLNGHTLTARARTAQAPQANSVVRPNAPELSAGPLPMNPAPAVIPSLPPPASTRAPLVTFEAPSADAASSDFNVQRRRIAGRTRVSQPSRQTGRFANIDFLLPAAQAILPATSQPFSFAIPATAPTMPVSDTAPAPPASVIWDQPARASSSVSFRFDNVADNVEGAAPTEVVQEPTPPEDTAPVAGSVPAEVTSPVEAQVALALADSVLPAPAHSPAAAFSAEEAHPPRGPGSVEEQAAVDVQLRAHAPETVQLAAARPTWFTRHFLQAVARLALNPLAQGRASFGWPSDSM